MLNNYLLNATYFSLDNSKYKKYLFLDTNTLFFLRLNMGIRLNLGLFLEIYQA